METKPFQHRMYTNSLFCKSEPPIAMSDIQQSQHSETSTQETSAGESLLGVSGFDQRDGNTVQTPPPFQLQADEHAPIQRQVRINGGATRVNEAEYQAGGAKEGFGASHPVDGLIADGVKRVFNNVAELEGYAQGQTDFIGDVHTQSGETYWYRLPELQLTVLGERHHNPAGNVEDVINGLGTSRFVYEPYHEFEDVGPFRQGDIGGGTVARTQAIEAGLDTGGQVDRGNFAPHLENIVIKAMTGASLTRNRFIAANPAGMDAATVQQYSGRPDNDSYSIGDRIALYLSMAIHIAQDISQYNFPDEVMIESNYFRSARRLSEFYLANQAELDGLMAAKDASDLVGIYELTQPGGFAILPMLNDFTVTFHEYGARYIEHLGVQSGDATLEAEGGALAGNLGAGLADMNPAREAIMWRRVMEANAGGYLIAGMGDAHRRSFVPRLAAAGIPQEETVASLTRQRAEIDANWVD